MITFQLEKGSAIATIDGWADTDGVAHTGLPGGYGAGAQWTADDGGLLVTLQNQLGSTPPTCNVVFRGIAGTFNLTCTLKKTGAVDLVGTQQIKLTGQPASLNMNVV